MTYLPDPATVSRHADQRSAGRTRFVATGAQTRGDFGLFEVTLGPGDGGPGPHLHRTFSESFHVLEGSLAVLDLLSGDVEGGRRRAAVAQRLDRQCFSGALAAAMLATGAGDTAASERIAVDG